MHRIAIPITPGMPVFELAIPCEVFAQIGLDIKSRADILGQVRRLVVAERVSVLWATHLIDEVAEDDDVVVLHQGRVLAHGPVASVVNATGAQDIRAAFTRLTQELPMQAANEAS